ncbi:hypothetical protein ABID21_005036 [Pseudorhizobium tarimense]|uniref:Uncharacterized protein n=1 Tax=Pseudorhizobium tarimense TaxID=1079109 RepID=A0ABV2HED9_9HYPH|nr:hypothetical protein [Pseudorhizobium tarimense]MCJ8521862.1 hypothetical protein [Pseudorhizobium tarimense]
MLSVSSINSPSLAILQQSSIRLGSVAEQDDQNDILQVANGVSSEPSSGTKSASAVAGKFAVDSALPTEGRIVVGGLGAADSWEELEELVKNNKTLTNREKKEWLVKLSEMQELAESVSAYINSSEFAEIKARAQQFSSSSDTRGSSEAHKAINSLSEKLGRERPFREF